MADVIRFPGAGVLPAPGRGPIPMPDRDAMGERYVAYCEALEAGRLAPVEALGEGPPQARSIESELADLAAMWAGVCEVSVAIPDSVTDAVNADWIAVGTVRDILVDAVANAAMHGHAAHVWISGDWSAAGEIEFTIVDDGTAGLGEERGLGTALLDAACVRWSREAVDGGVRLNAVTAVPVGA